MLLFGMVQIWKKLVINPLAEEPDIDHFRYKTEDLVRPASLFVQISMVG